MFKHVMHLVSGKPSGNTGVREYLATCPDGKYVITILSVKDAKTLEQNNYFHKLCQYMMEPSGYSFHESKEHLKREFGITYHYADLETGEMKEELKSIADYTKEELSVLIARSAEFLIDFYEVKLPPLPRDLPEDVQQIKEQFNVVVTEDA